ncbi:MAG: hypothetical protein HY897_23455 [Deltaproteobacteria bacterium]|nr:hypothetical protein [Deltaproteobacteria bacterium]
MHWYLVRARFGRAEALRKTVVSRFHETADSEFAVMTVSKSKLLLGVARLTPRVADVILESKYSCGFDGGSRPLRFSDDDADRMRRQEKRWFTFATFRPSIDPLGTSSERDSELAAVLHRQPWCYQWKNRGVELTMAAVFLLVIVWMVFRFAS